MKHGYYYRPDSNPNRLLYAKGSYYNATGKLQTHFIHVVLANSKDWNSYIKFKERLLNDKEVLKAYEELKLKLYLKGIDRTQYTTFKNEFIESVLNDTNKA